MPAGPTNPEAAPAAPPVAPRKEHLNAAREVRLRFKRFVDTTIKKTGPRDALTLIAQQNLIRFRTEQLAKKPNITQTELNDRVEAMQNALDKQVSKMLQSKDPRERAGALDFMKYRLQQLALQAKGDIQDYQKLHDEAQDPKEKAHYAKELEKAKERFNSMEEDKKSYMNADGVEEEMTFKEQVNKFSDPAVRNEVKGKDGNPVPDQIMELAKKLPGYDPKQENALVSLTKSIQALIQNRNPGANIVKAFREANLTHEERESLNFVIEMTKLGKTSQEVLIEHAAKGGLMMLLMMFLFGYLSSKMDKGQGGQMAMAHG